MRKIAALSVLVTVFAALTAVEARPPKVVDIPVAFSVRNINDSATKCQADGLSYIVRGNLVARESVLVDSTHDAVTLYLHGSGDGSTWHFPAVSGVPNIDHVTEMARKGHVSVFLHALGYGPSDDANGNGICFGSFPAMAHQVVQALRSGDYASTRASHPAFERVALMGHSGGGVIAETYAVSYADIDAVGIVGWADVAPTMPGLFRAAAQFGVKCAQGGEAGAPPGWAHVFSDKSDFDTLFYNADPRVKEAFIPLYEPEPCGIANDVGQMIAMSAALAPTVEIPVLLAYGDREPFSPGAFELMRTRYVGSDDVSLAVIPDSGHMLMIGRTARAFRAELSEWLRARGF